jgi:hypothetical protein
MCLVFQKHFLLCSGQSAPRREFGRWIDEDGDNEA